MVEIPPQTIGLAPDISGCGGHGWPVFRVRQTVEKPYQGYS
jgi:hypothetical protein